MTTNISIPTLVADSGATKTDWALVSGSECLLRVQTQGLNPFFHTSEEVESVLRNELLPHLSTTTLRAIHFYGAGCTPERGVVVQQALLRVFAVADDCTVQSDMAGAAYALCGNERGIVCIMGTGSNSCLWNGNGIEDQVSPLGFILGDEGSGAVLGRTLVADVFKRQLPKDVIAAFHSRFPYTQAEIIERVYRQPQPSRFLSSFAPFLSEQIAHPAVRALVCNQLRRFLQRNVAQYTDCHVLPIHFVGSIAHHFQPVLEEALQLEQMQLGRILTSPIEGLVERVGAEDGC